MQNRAQSAKKPCRLFTFGWSLLCWPSYRDTLFIGLARKAATSSCFVLFTHRVTMEVPMSYSFTHSHVHSIFFWDLVCLPSPFPFGEGLIGNSGMRFFGRCWVKIDICLQWRDVWCCMDPFSMQAKAGGVMGYLLGWEEHLFSGWIWGKQCEATTNPAVTGGRATDFLGDLM